MSTIEVVPATAEELEEKDEVLVVEGELTFI